MKKLLLGLILSSLLLAECSNSEQQTNFKSSTQSTTSNSKSSATSETSSETKEPKATVGILGSNITDVRMGLNDVIGMPEGSISPTKSSVNGAFMTSSTFDLPDGSLSLDYALTCDADYQITTGIIGLTSYGVASNEDILNFAKNYLGYCITLPYDSAEIDVARQWLDDNILNYASQPKTTIGDATFSLDGKLLDNSQIGYISLSIRKNDLDEQIIANMEE